MKALIITLAVIAAIISLLCLPKVKLRLSYDKEFSAAVKFLFIKKEFAAKEEKPKAPSATTETAKKKDAKTPRFLRGITFSDWIEIIKIFFTEFVFKIKIEKFTLKATVATDDAARTALLYGKISGATYPILSFLSAKNALKKADVDVRADFLSETSEYRGEAIFSVRLISLIITGIKAGYYLITRESLPEK